MRTYDDFRFDSRRSGPFEISLLLLPDILYQSLTIYLYVVFEKAVITVNISMISMSKLTFKEEEKADVLMLPLLKLIKS